MIELVEAAGVRWAALVWPLAWQGAAVALIALAILPLVRRISPAVGLGLLGVALLKFFVPPVVSAPLAFIDLAATAVRPAAPLSDEGAIAGLLMMVHGIGVAAGLLRLAVRRRQLSRLVAASKPIANDERNPASAIARQLGMTRQPDVRESASIESPLAIGVRRPIVLLPPGLGDVLSPDQLRIVIAHEIVHHRHRDLAVETLVAMACAVWWFHPLVRMLAARVRELREDRCDDRVVSLGISAYDYCRALLDVAAVDRPSPAVAMRPAAHALRRRFERLMTTRRPHRAAIAVASAGIAAFAAAALPHSSLRRDPADVSEITNAIVRSQVRVERVVSVTP